MLGARDTTMSRTKQSSCMDGAYSARNKQIIIQVNYKLQTKSRGAEGHRGSPETMTSKRKS